METGIRLNLKLYWLRSSSHSFPKPLISAAKHVDDEPGRVDKALGADIREMIYGNGRPSPNCHRYLGRKSVQVLKTRDTEHHQVRRLGAGVYNGGPERDGDVARSKSRIMSLAASSRTMLGQFALGAHRR